MKMGRKRLALFAVAGAAVLAAIAGTASAATVAFSPSIPPTARPAYACVNLSIHTTFQVFDTPPRCLIGQTLIELGAQGKTGPQGPPGTNAGPLSVTSVVNIKNDPDSNNSGGTWATDTITRTFTVTRHAAAPLSDCPSAPAGNDTCYYYTGTLADSGQFVTINGAKSPNDSSVTVSGNNPGTFTGGSSFEFYADSATLQASSLSMVDESVTPFSGSSDPKWYESFFPAGIKADGINEPNWSWTYQTSGTCESMTQAFSGETGNITGVSHC